jgi:hypothetical protein
MALDQVIDGNRQMSVMILELESAHNLLDRCPSLLLPFIIAHLTNVPPVLDQVSHELSIFLLNRVLFNFWEKPDDRSTEKAQAACDEEGVLTLSDHITSTVRLDNGEDVIPNNWKS